jgi:hypothetical protein
VKIYVFAVYSFAGICAILNVGGVISQDLKFQR